MTDPNTNSTQNVTATSAFEGLVGPGKKFASAEDLAKGKLNADAMIDTLKTETRELRTLVTSQESQLQKLASKVSILDRLSVNPDDDGNQPVVQKVVTQPEPKAVGLTVQDVREVVAAEREESAALANQREVDGVLNKLFGAEAKGFVLQKAAEFRVAPEELVDMARRSPQMFYNTLGISPNTKQSSSTYVGNKTGTIQTTAEPVRNNAYYEGLKKKMGTKAFVMDRGLQAQRMRDLAQLGDAWDATE